MVIKKQRSTPPKRRPCFKLPDLLTATAPTLPTPWEVPTKVEVGTPARKLGRRNKATKGKKKRRHVAPYVEDLSLPWPTTWSALPATALGTIASRLFESPPDLGAFNAVCRAWRSAAGEAKRAAFSSGRPLLLLPPSPSHDVCRFHRLPAAAGGAAYGGRRTIGFSHGHLIVFDDDVHRPLLINLSDGKETWFPRTEAHTYSYYGVLTAAPGKACVLLLLCVPEGGLQHCMLGEESWSLHQFASAGWFFAAAEVVGDKVYALSNMGHLVVMDLVHHRQRGGSSAPFCLEEEHVEVEGFPGYFPHGSLPPMLVRSGKEMLLIRVGVRTEFYRLDLSGRTWTKVEMGDCALSASHHGCSVSFVPPSRWRIRQGRLHLKGSGSGFQTVLPLEGSQVDGVFAKPQWPSPIWILRSMQYGSPRCKH